jgi:pilus assembly protein CpaE
MQHTTTHRSTPTVIVIGVHGTGLGHIRECLSTEAAIPNEMVQFTEAMAAIRRYRPQVAIVGFDGDFDAAIRLGSTLGAEHPGLVLIAHATIAQPERIRSAMRAGFRDFVVLPEDADLLRRTVREAPSETTVATDQGQVVAVIGAKGGCGSSFVTVNLGAELAPVHRVCAIDLDFSMGDLASMLDLQTPSNIQDLLGNLNRLDERMLAGSVGVHPSGLHVLSQPMDLVDDGLLRGDDVLKVLSTAADAYQYLLVDCGGRIDEATRTVSTVADLILLVCVPDVPSVKNAWRRLHLLDRQGVDLSRVRLVVNRWGKNPPLNEADIESNLGIPVAATIANDPKRCQHAVNVGALLRDVDKRCAAARDISGLVSLITEGVERVEPSSPNHPLSWLFS